MIIDRSRNENNMIKEAVNYLNLGPGMCAIQYKSRDSTNNRPLNRIDGPLRTKPPNLADMKVFTW